MGEVFPTIDHLFGRLTVMNSHFARTGTPYLISLTLPFTPGSKGSHGTNPPEREPYVGGRKPYWPSFAEYERDVRALDAKLRADGQRAIIRAWLPMAA